MAAEILREYLISLGFKVEAGGQRNMMDAIASMTLKVTELAGAVETAATAVVYGVSKIVGQFEQLYYVSARTGQSVGNISAFGYAVSQMGGTVEGARQSMENFSRFLRSSPGAINVLQGLGIQIYDTNGKMRDFNAIAGDMQRVFRAMPISRANMYRNMLGMDENTFFAIVNGLGTFSQEYHEMAQKVGIDSDAAARSSLFFMRRLRSLETAITLVFQKISTDMAGSLGRDLENLRQLILNNSDQIVQSITALAHILLWLAQVVVRVVVRATQAFRDLRDFWNSLPPDFRRGIETILGIAFAFRLLNAVIARGPFGLLMLLATLLLALYDDYKTWQEGGKHFINWDYWGPEIQKAWDGIKAIARVIDEVVQAIGGWKTVAYLFLAWYTGTFLLRMVATTTAAIAQMTAASTASMTSLTTTASGALGILARLALRAGPLAAVIAAMWPSNTQTQDQENAIMGRAPGTGAFGTPGAGNTLAGGGGFSNDVIKFFMGRGWSLAQAAGIAANIRAESNFNPTAVGDRGQAYGLGQWHPDRQRLFEQFMLETTGRRKSIRDSTFDEQLGFYDWELRHNEAGAGNLLRQQTTAEGAGRAVVQAERPADMLGASASRAADARRLQEAYLSSGQGGGVTVNQNNNVTVSGVRDPHEAAAAVGAEHRRNNADLQRNLQGAVR